MQRKLIWILATMALIIGLCASMTQAQTFNPVVAAYGTQDAKMYSSVDGSFVSNFVAAGNGLASPHDIVYHDGKVYVLGAGTKAVLRYTDNGDGTTTFDGSWSATGFALPLGLSVYGQFVYVADFSGNAIYRHSLSDGVRDAGYTVSVTSPYYIAHDSFGNLYVAGDGGVKKYDVNGSLVAPGISNSGWRGIAVDSVAGKLYVMHGPSKDVYSSDLNLSAWTNVFHTTASTPYGMRLGPDGKLYIVALVGSGYVYRYATDGTQDSYAITGLSSPTNITFKAPIVAMPALSPDAQPIAEPTAVTITCATSGATIRYTTDGTVPTNTAPENGTIIASGGNVTINPGTTLKARAFAAGMFDSALKSATYISLMAATPVFSPDGGRITAPTSVTITSATSGATIRYTTDGSEPTSTNGTAVANGGSVTVDPDTVLKARAFATGLSDSAVKSAAYYNQLIAVGDYTAHLAKAYNTLNGGLHGDYITAGSGGLVRPHDLTYASDGNTYVASFGTGQVLRYDGNTGAFIDVFASAFNGVSSVSAYGDYLYVVQMGAKNITRYSLATGSLDSGYSVTLSIAPYFVAHDGSGNMYVTAGDSADAGKGIYKYDEDGNLLTSFGHYTNALYAWRGIAVDRTEGAVYAISNGNNFLHKFTLDGVDEGVIGGAKISGLISPYGMKLGPDGNLYIADLGSSIGFVKKVNKTTGAVDPAFSLSVTTMASNVAFPGYLPVEDMAEMPTFSPSGGVISGPTAVTITSATAGATVRYTTDTTDPTDINGTVLANGGSVTVVPGTFLKARAFASGLSDSAIRSAVYEVANYNRPAAISYTSGINVNANLDDWSDALWVPLDVVYNGNPSDIVESYMAAKWKEDKVYVAVKVNDTGHEFLDSYGTWNGRDAVEIYLHTTAGQPYSYISDGHTAQQYAVGITETDNSQVWASLNAATTSEIGGISSIGFVAAGAVNGDWLLYEAAMTPYEYLDPINPASSIVSPLSAGDIIGLDVVAVSHNGTVYTGSLAENNVINKWSDWRFFGQHVLVTPSSIADAKNAPIGASVSTSGVVTGVFGDVVYVESTDRTTGIQVRKPGHGVATGDSVLVSGGKEADVDTGELYIDASYGAISGRAGTELAPLGTNNKSIGGGANSGQPGVAGGTGLNNIALLVKAWGRVTDLGGGRYLLEDGSGVGLTMELASGSVANGAYVSAVGVVSCEKVGSDIKPLLLVESDSNIEAF